MPVSIERNIVIVDEFFFASAYSASMSTKDSLAFLAMETWADEKKKVIVPPCWVSLAQMELIRRWPDSGIDTGSWAFPYANMAQLRVLSMPSELLLRAFSLGDYLRFHEDPFYARDAEYLVIAEALKAEIWTTNPEFPARIADIVRLRDWAPAISRLFGDLEDGAALDDRFVWGADHILSNIQLLPE